MPALFVPPPRVHGSQRPVGRACIPAASAPADRPPADRARDALRSCWKSDDQPAPPCRSWPASLKHCPVPDLVKADAPPPPPPPPPPLEARLIQRGQEREKRPRRPSLDERKARGRAPMVANRCSCLWVHSAAAWRWRSNRSLARRHRGPPNPAHANVARGGSALWVARRILSTTVENTPHVSLTAAFPAPSDTRFRRIPALCVCRLPLPSQVPAGELCNRGRGFFVRRGEWPFSSQAGSARAVWERHPWQALRRRSSKLSLSATEFNLEKEVRQAPTTMIAMATDPPRSSGGGKAPGLAFAGFSSGVFFPPACGRQSVVIPPRPTRNDPGSRPRCMCRRPLHGAVRKLFDVTRKEKSSSCGRGCLRPRSGETATTGCPSSTIAKRKKELRGIRSDGDARRCSCPSLRFR